MADLELKLNEILAEYFKIGDSYHYELGRDKEAFDLGTMTLGDFAEYDQNTVAEIAAHLIAQDVFPVVRCEHCRFYKPLNAKGAKPWGSCNKNTMPCVYPDSFCWKGERK